MQSSDYLSRQYILCPSERLFTVMSLAPGGLTRPETRLGQPGEAERKFEQRSIFNQVRIILLEEDYIMGTLMNIDCDFKFIHFFLCRK